MLRLGLHWGGHCLMLKVTVRHQHSATSSAQRPYDIHSSDAMESLVQLFGTVSVQYVPSWSKEMVALLRKVSPSPSTGPPDTRGVGYRALVPGGICFLHVCLAGSLSVRLCPIVAWL